MSLKSIIPWLVIAVVCIALMRVGVNMYAGMKDDLNKMKKKVVHGRKTAKKKKRKKNE